MDPLHAHLNLMPSVRRATQLRADTLLSLQTLLSDQERLTNRINKLAPDITKHVKIEQLKRELEETNRLAENAKKNTIASALDKRMSSRDQRKSASKSLNKCFWD